MENYLNYQSNNLLIVMKNLMDVMEAMLQMHFYMLNPIHKNLGHNTLTQPQLKLAKRANTLVLFIPMDTLLFQLNLPLNFWLQLKNNQFQSQLMQAQLFSINTNLESLIPKNVVQILTTESLLLVLELIKIQDNITISLETHGEINGEKKDM